VSGKSFWLLQAALFLYAVAVAFGKRAGLAILEAEARPVILWLGLEMAALGVYAFLWQLTLKSMPLSFAYTNKAVCVLWTFLFGIAFFGEAVTLGKAAGILLTLAGVGLVVTDHE